MKGSVEFKNWSAAHNGSILTEFKAYRRGEINPSAVARKGNKPSSKATFINKNGQIVETDNKGREIVLRANTRLIGKK